MNHLNDFFQKLGLSRENGLYLRHQELPDSYPSRIKISLQSIEYDAIFDFENKPIFIFKEFNVIGKDTDTKMQKMHEKVWNFGETPILFIVLPNEIHIYNGFVFDRDKRDAWKKLLFTDDTQLADFSFINLYSGNLWNKYRKEFGREKHVHDYLLRNLSYARERLREKGLPYEIIHNLISRLIFSRYLLDRKVLNQQFFYDAYNLKFEDVIQNKKSLYNYFQYLKEHFNGDLFDITKEEFNVVEEKHLRTLADLFKGKDIEKNQTILFDIYDFAIIPIELISNIYERFLNKEIKMDSEAYYTPTFLVDYILSHTLDEILENNKDEKCRILDPACGSGVFLVESLRRLIEKRKKKNNGKVTKETLKEIVMSNIYGIDKDPDAINLTIFSIYLTLLDYQDPKDISTFKFPELKGNNLFVADTFDCDASFNKIIKDMDLIVGNPPWASISCGHHIDYCDSREIPISDYQIAQSFLVRVSDFSHSNTRMSLIVTSKILYNIQAYNFRKYFLEHYRLKQILEFSCVRRDAFNSAIGPGAIIFYNCGRPKNNDVIEHISLKPNIFFSLFQIIVVEKYDVKYISQDKFLTNDWLWKAALFGNSLDFRFISRILKDNYSLAETLDQNDLKFGSGLIKGNTNFFKELVGYKLINHTLFNDYFIDTESAERIYDGYFHRKGSIESYLSPHLIVKRSIKDRPALAYSDDDFAFSNLFYGISAPRKKITLLKNIGAVLSSRFMSYLLFLMSSQWGIERDEIYKKEYLRLPIPEHINDSDLYEDFDELSALARNKFMSNDNKKLTQSDNIIQKQRLIIDKGTCDLYNINELELDLIDFMCDISIPVFKGKKEPLNITSNAQLENYANVFIHHFKNHFSTKFFNAEIYSSQDFVLIKFNVSNEKNESILHIEDAEINMVMAHMGVISITELSKNLFIQKDIKGFGKDYFFVSKPNEYKNWHRAIARLDLSEFLDAMIKANMGDL